MNQKDATRLVAALKEMGVSVREEREGVVCISVEAKHGRADIFYDQAYTLRAILELLGGATPSGLYEYRVGPHRPLLFDPVAKDLLRAACVDIVVRGRIGELPILGDILQDNGCDDPAVAEHCAAKQHHLDSWLFNRLFISDEFALSRQELYAHLKYAHTNMHRARLMNAMRIRFATHTDDIVRDSSSWVGGELHAAEACAMMDMLYEPRALWTEMDRNLLPPSHFLEDSRRAEHVVATIARRLNDLRAIPVT